MEKEEKPVQNPEKNINIKQNPQIKPEEKKIPLSKSMKHVIPKEFRPTAKTNWFFGAIFVTIVIISILNVPFASIAKQENLEPIKVGWPWSFLVFDIENPEKLPIRILGLIGDLVLYLIAAYGLDVTINLMFKKSVKKKD
jgi:hypothetical protein